MNRPCRAPLHASFTVWAIVGVGIGLLVQVVRIIGAPQEFRSLAKLMVVDQSSAQGDDVHSLHPQVSHDMRQALESVDLRRRALERMRTTQPDLRDRDVEIRAVQAKGTATLNILATSSEPMYTKLFLSVLVEEYLKWQYDLPADAAGQGPKGPLHRVIVQEHATAAAENVQGWVMPMIAGAFGGGGLAVLLFVVFHLSSLRPSAAPAPSS